MPSFIHIRAIGRAMLCALALTISCTAAAQDGDWPEPRELIRAAMEQWRGLTSFSEMTMIVHREDWERRFSMRAWTEGDENSLVRVTAPRRDAGNATLVIDEAMWSYSPKINRVLKIPSSMMAQSWMGSDFSNKDISKSTDIIDRYDHRLLAVDEEDDHRIFTIESIPHEDAAVVWGREVTRIRDDYILLRQEFWDQDGVLIKVMNATEIGVMDGRAIATRLRMHEVDKPAEWTEMIVDSVDFDVDIAPGLFTLSNLQNPRI